MTRVAVFVPTTTVGFPEDEPSAGASPKLARAVRSLPLGEALAHRHAGDAHFVAYASKAGLRLRVSYLDPAAVANALRRREQFTSEAIAAAMAAPCSVEMVALVADVDDPATHATGEPARDSWREAERAKIVALLETYPRAFVYATRGGYRIVFLLASPFVIVGAERYRAWRRYYVLALTSLSRRFGIVADPACRDWTRCYRAPFVVRDGKREERPIWGDASSLGEWTYAPCAEDEAELDRLADDGGPKGAWAIARRSFAAPVEARCHVRAGAQSNTSDVRSRAQRYLAHMPAAISGKQGHAATFRAAVALVRGFELDEETALALLEADFNPRCRPAWSRAELAHKVKSASRAHTPAGYLRAR